MLTQAQQKTIQWLANGSTGVSSETMAFWLAFELKKKHCGHPRDPNDLDRCLRLLEAVPELRKEMHYMAEISPEWEALIARWEEIERSHLDEVGLGWTKALSAPKTYKLMRKILSECMERTC